MSCLLVSVLMPTRGRVELARRSIESLLNNCADASRVEIMVAYDNDDTDSANYFTSPRWTELITSHGARSKVLSCEPWGYAGLHRYYTAMARQAQGEWFMIWNDDAVMQSRDWDQHLADNRNWIGLLHMYTANFKPTLTLFPLIPRVWLDLFGEISLHQLNDSWIQDVCHQADAVKHMPVSIFHDRYDVTGNNLDETYARRRYDKKIYNHESMQAVRAEWAQRLRQYRQQNCACDTRPDLT